MNMAWEMLNASLAGPWKETTSSGLNDPAAEAVRELVGLFFAELDTEVRQTTNRLQRSNENFW